MSSPMELVMAETSDKAYKELRLILEEQYSQSFTLEEVKEIGDGLVDFYSILVEFYNDC